VEASRILMISTNDGFQCEGIRSCFLYRLRFLSSFLVFQYGRPDSFSLSSRVWDLRRSASWITPILVSYTRLLLLVLAQYGLRSISRTFLTTHVDGFGKVANWPFLKVQNLHPTGSKIFFGPPRIHTSLGILPTFVIFLELFTECLMDALHYLPSNYAYAFTRLFLRIDMQPAHSPLDLVGRSISVHTLYSPKNGFETPCLDSCVLCPHPDAILVSCE